MWIHAAVQIWEWSQLPIPTIYKFLNLLQAENVGREERKPVFSFFYAQSAGREWRPVSQDRVSQKGGESKYLARPIEGCHSLSLTCLPTFSRCGKSKSLKQSSSVLSFQGFLANFLLRFPGNLTAGICTSSAPRKQNLGQGAAEQRVSLHRRPLQILPGHSFSTNIPQEECSPEH